MNTTKKIIILLLLVTVTFSCEDYLDVNDDPNAPSNVAIDLRLKPVILLSNGAAQWRASREIMLVTQYGASKDRGASSETWKFTNLYMAWQNIFVWAYPNAIDLIVMGEDQNCPHFSGVGKIFKAFLLFLATDQHGSIPYDDLYNGRDAAILTPRFEEQKVIYEKCLAVLDEAIIDLSQTDNEIDLDRRGGDIIYQGDIENWIKFAYALKARYLNHYSKKSSLYDPAAIIEACSKSFDGDEQDAEFPYNANGPGGQKNPFSAGGFGDAQLYASSFSNFYINTLKSSPLTSDSIDPRLPIITDTAANTGLFTGVITGRGFHLGPNPALYSPFQGGFYTSGGSPFPFITYAEVKFIEAEARYRNGDIAGSRLAFREGVLANMRKLGVEASLISVAETKIDALNDFDTKTLHYIMTQKYIALTLHPETWVDMRRMDYNSTIYPGLVQPENLNPIFGPDEWIRAMPYDHREEQRNSTNLPDNTPSVRMKTPVWWDVAE